MQTVRGDAQEWEAATQAPGSLVALLESSDEKATLDPLPASRDLSEQILGELRALRADVDAVAREVTDTRLTLQAHIVGRELKLPEMLVELRRDIEDVRVVQAGTDQVAALRDELAALRSLLVS